MRKLVLLTLALLCLCLCTSCNDSVSISTETSVSFVPGVKKYLSATNDFDISAILKVDEYYWEYSSLVYQEGMDIQNALTNSHFTPFFPDPDNLEVGDSLQDYMIGVGEEPNTVYKYFSSEKGMNREISGFAKNGNYVFGVRGYNDPERTQLVWEGITDKPQKLTKPLNEIILLMNFYSTEKGKIFFDIKAPGNSLDEGEVIFVYSFIGEKLLNDLGKDSFHPITSTDFHVLTPTNFTTNTDWIYSYKTGSTPELELNEGLYFFTVKEMVKDNDGNWIDFPNRTNIVLANVLPGANTYIIGYLGEYIITEIESLQVFFHSTFDYQLNELTITTSTDTTSSSYEREYTVITVDQSDNITWMISGCYLSETNCPLPIYETEPEDNSQSYILDKTKDDGVLLFYRANYDGFLYVFTCLYNIEDADLAMSKSIDLF